MKLKKIKVFKDNLGSLVPFYKNQFKNFNIKRFFFIYGKLKKTRADHAHKKCDQIYIHVKGTIKVEIENRKKVKKIITMNDKNKGLISVPKWTWTKINFKSKDGILLVLCNYKYDRSEYIENKKEFFK
jgi:dTDP-4-dehydrorhamnose 3,5-epimerase-like enzyme